MSRPVAIPEPERRIHRWNLSGVSYASGVVDDLRRALRQRNELRLAGDGAEASRLPVGGGARDALAPAGDEVPPEEALAIERLAGEKQHARVARGADARRGACGEHQHASRLVPLAFVLDRAGSDIGGAFGIAEIKVELGTGA